MTMTYQGYQHDLKFVSPTNTLSQRYISPQQQQRERIAFISNRYWVVNGNLIVGNDLGIQVLGSGHVELSGHLFNLPAPMQYQDGNVSMVRGGVFNFNGALINYIIDEQGRVILQQRVIISAQQEVALNIRPYLAQTPIRFPPDFDL